MILLVDGNNLAYRVFSAYPYLTTQKGKPVHVIYGVLKLLRAAITRFKPESVFVAWDGSPQRRKLLYPEYKANRNLNRNAAEEQAYKEYREQLVDLTFILKYTGVHQYRGDNAEADDLISVLADFDGEYIILSEDKDMLQLVNNRVSVYRPMKDVHYTQLNFVTLTGLTPKQFLESRTLQGDSSDNIPGIRGIGEKTAAKLIKEHGCLDNLVDYSKSNVDRWSKTIYEYKQVIIRNKMLMDLRFAKDMIPDSIHGYKIQGTFDEARLKQIFVSYEFFSYVKGWTEFIAPFGRLS